MKIDVNCDCGEGFGNWSIGSDEQLLPHVSSVNLACGFHAGDPATMVRSVRLAKQNRVAVGAHPGLPDLVGFGRRRISVTPEEVYADVMYQAGALKAVLASEGMPLHHVKVHGALAFLVKESEELASSYLDAVEAVMEKPLVYSPCWPDSAMHELAEQRRIPVALEYYPDLRYTADGSISLARTREPVPAGEITEQLESLFSYGKVKAEDGALIPMDVQSISFHSDAPNASEVVEAINRSLQRRKIERTAVEVGK